MEEAVSGWFDGLRFWWWRVRRAAEFVRGKESIEEVLEKGILYRVYRVKGMGPVELVRLETEEGREAVLVATPLGFRKYVRQAPGRWKEYWRIAAEERRTR
jgi:hypothetical protein